MSIYDQEWDDERQMYVSGRKVGRPLGPNAPHYPNKAERALLHKMMQEGQCSEEEIRSRKGNRQKLAAAAKSMSQRKNPGSRFDYELKKAKRQIARRLGVPVYDPKVQKMLHAKDTSAMFRREEKSVYERIQHRTLGYY